MKQDKGYDDEGERGYDVCEYARDGHLFGVVEAILTPDIPAYQGIMMDYIYHNDCCCLRFFFPFSPDYI